MNFLMNFASVFYISQLLKMSCLRSHKGQWYVSNPHPQWSPSSLVFCPQQIIKITFSWRLCENIIHHEEWRALCPDHTSTRRLVHTQSKSNIYCCLSCYYDELLTPLLLVDCISFCCLRKELGWHRTDKKCALCAWRVGGEQKCQHTIFGLHT